MTSRKVFLFLGTLGVVTLLGAGCVRNSAKVSPSPPPGGVYESRDKGVTWVQMVNFSGGGDITQVSPRQVLIDPFEPDIIYMAAERSGLLHFNSSDKFWKQQETPASTVTGVAIHPRNPNILYLAGTSQEAPERSKIWKTFDRGETWQEVYAEPQSIEESGIFRRRRVVPTVVTVFALDPQRPEVVFAGSSSGALIASADGGNSWSTQHSFKQGIVGLKVSPLVQSQVFVSLEDGALVRSDDGGRTAKQLAVREGDTRASSVFSLLFSRGEEGSPIIFVGTNQGLFRSDDAGETWEVVSLPVSEKQFVPVRAVAQSLDGTLWAGSGFNIYSSRDQGGAWRVHQFSFPRSIRHILTHPTEPSILYAFFSPG